MTDTPAPDYADPFTAARQHATAITVLSNLGLDLDLNAVIKKSPCSCGHRADDHTRDDTGAHGRGRCTESADRAGWSCPCERLRPSGDTGALLVALTTVAAELDRVREQEQQWDVATERTLAAVARTQLALDAAEVENTRLRGVTDKILVVMEHIEMDTDEDRDLHRRAIATFRAAVGPVTARPTQASQPGPDPAQNDPARVDKSAAPQSS